MFTKNLHLPYLLDIYGELLSERKRQLLDYYYEEDYSLSEISELTGISRQGVRDSVKKSEAELIAFEEKLHLFNKISEIESIVKSSSEIINDLLSSADERSAKKLLSLKDGFKAIEELL